MCLIPPFFTSAYASASEACYHAKMQATNGIISAAHTCAQTMGKCKDRAAKFFKTDEGIVRFVKNNWKRLFLYTLAWAIIVSGMGMMYGFKVTAIPLTIGIGCGAAFGVLTGILTACVFDKKNSRPTNTLWGFLNRAFNSLDANGTRAIVVSVCVTVVLAAAVVFPYALGAIFGIIIGNHLATKISFNVKKSLHYEIHGYLEMGSNSKDPDVLAQRVKTLQATLDQLRVDVNALDPNSNSV